MGLNEVANLLIISRCVLSELALIVVFWLGASGHPIGAYVYIYIYIYNLSLSLSLSLYIYIFSLSIYIYIYMSTYKNKTGGNPCISMQEMKWSKVMCDRVSVTEPNDFEQFL